MGLAFLPLARKNPPLPTGGREKDGLDTLGRETIAPSPGVSSERVDLFLAEYGQADRTAAGGGVEGENELIAVEEVPLSVLWTWVEQRRIEDLKSLALILALRVRRPELFA